MGYVSVGGAISGALSEYMEEQAKQRQLDLRNKMEVWKLQMEAQNAQQDHDFRMRQLQYQEKKQEQADWEKGRADTRQEVNDTHIQGDYMIDPDLNARIEKYHLQGEMYDPQTSKPAVKAQPVGALSTPPGMGGAGIPVNQGLAGSDLQPERPAVYRFAGTAKQRQVEADRDRMTQAFAYLQSPEGAKLRQDPVALETWWHTNKIPGSIPPAMLNITKPVFMLNARTGKMEQQGEVPADAVIREQQFPPTVNVNAGNPTPVLMQRNDGTPGALQWKNGQYTEVPLPAGYSGKLGTTPGPITSAIRTRMDFAKRLGSHVPEIRAEVEQAEKLGILGPAMGRWNDFLAGTYGETGDPVKDEFIGKFRNDISFLRSGMGVVHSGAKGAAAQMVAQMIKNLNTEKMSKGLLVGALNSYDSYLKTYGDNPDAGAEPSKSDNGIIDAAAFMAGRKKK